MGTPLERLRLLYNDKATHEWYPSKDALQEPFQGPDKAVAQAEGKMPSSSDIAQMPKDPDEDIHTSISKMDLDQVLERKQHLKGVSPQVRGEVGAPGGYCPILALSKFPYKYMNPKSSTSEFISKKFFANNLFWKNTWNLYYLSLPSSIAGKPLILIPEAEAQAFIGFIAHQSGIRLSLPATNGGIVVTFEKDGAPFPRYLGMSTCREDFHSLEAAVPTAQIDFKERADGSIIANCSHRTFEEWAAKIERAVAATKNKAKASKEKRKVQRVQTKTEWSRQLKRAQRYLGVRGISVAGSMSVKSQEGHYLETTSDQYLELEDDLILDPNVLVPYQFDSDVVLLSLDVEAYEHGSKQVTEIGIAKLDTRDLSGICPGEGGKNWMEKVKGRHFWIKEHAHLTNRDYVAGCPDKYEPCFGTSEIVPTSRAVEILECCFQNPALASSVKDLSPETTPSSEKTGDPANMATQTESCSSSSVTNVALEPLRKVVVVGHDISQDINYLKDIKFDLLDQSSILEILDTSELYRAMRHEENPPSVSTMLYNLGISGWNLHNAGNDAAYTLQALLGIVLRSMSQDDGKRANLVEMIENARNEAEERVRDNLKEWDLASEDGNTDGGPPQSPSSRAVLKKEKKVRIQAGGVE